MNSRILFISYGKIPADSNRLLLFTLLLSLILHGTARWISLRPIPLPSLSEEKQTPVEVSRAEISSGRGTQRRVKTDRPGVTGRSGRLSLRDLGINWNHASGFALPTVGTGDRGVASLGGGGGNGAPAGVQNAVTYQAIYDRLDSAFYYPKEFQEAGIGGQASATLVFDEEGNWRKEKSSVHAPASRYLEVFVTQLLRKTLTEPISVDSKRRQEIRVRCEFHLEGTRSENAWDPSRKAVDRMESRKAFAGNQLYFYRYGKVLGEWSLGPLHGYGIMPSVGIDLEWIGEKAGSVFSKKEKADPLLKYRLDPAWEAN